jgi:hypothetical protein
VKNLIQKLKQIKSSYLVGFLGIVILVSCAGNTKSPGQNYSESAIKLCKKAVKLNDELSNSQDMQDYYEEFIKILNDPSPETYIMKAIDEKQPSGLKYLYIGNAFKCLEKAFTAYNLQLDPKISASDANLSEKFLMACEALDSIGLDDALKTKNLSIKKNIGLGKYRLEGTLFQLTDIYAEAWNQIGQKELINQMGFQKDYENGIRNIPVSAFNSEKVKTIITEPYSSNAVLVNLYKLKLIKDNKEEISKLEARINNISESLNLLLQIQGELFKRKQDKLKLQEYNNSLEVLLTNE